MRGVVYGHGIINLICYPKYLDAVSLPPKKCKDFEHTMSKILAPIGIFDFKILAMDTFWSYSASPK